MTASANQLRWNGRPKFEAADSRHRLVGEIRAAPERLVGVRYEDPGGCHFEYGLRTPLPGVELLIQ
jgi:hypothetical protein